MSEWVVWCTLLDQCCSIMQATSRMLASSTAADREATLRFADAAQWEYEDEYDDSYDDLAPFGNDAAADVEG